MTTEVDGSVLPGVLAELRVIAGLVTVEECWFTGPIPLEDLGDKVPGLFPYLSREETGIPATLGIEQHLEQTIGIWIICHRERFPALRAEVRDRLLGWQPAPAYDMTRYEGGKLIQLTGSVRWWCEFWTTGHYIRNRQTY